MKSCRTRLLASIFLGGLLWLAGPGCGEESDTSQPIGGLVKGPLDITNPSNGLRCMDGTSLPEERICDGRPDCPQGEDEMGCPE